MCELTRSFDSSEVKDKEFITQNNSKPPTTALKCPARWCLFVSIAIVVKNLPTEYYLNRGYTIWFYCTCIVALVLRINFLNRFVALQGIGISVGWYTAIFYDMITNSRGFHILYANVPTSMKSVIFDNSTGLVLNTPESTKMKIASHVMDTIGHPGLTILFLWICLRNGGRLRDLSKLSVVVSAYCFSRLWSVVHNYHNYNKFGMYYAGHHIYTIDSLDIWFNVYVAEGAVYAVAFVFGGYDLYLGIIRRSKNNKLA